MGQIKAVMKIPPDRLPDHGKAVHVRHIYDDELHYLEIKGADKAMVRRKEKKVPPSRRRKEHPRSVEWTEAETEKLIRIYEADLPLKDICAEMGRSKNSVQKKLRRLHESGRVAKLRPVGKPGKKGHESSEETC